MTDDTKTPDGWPPGYEREDWGSDTTFSVGWKRTDMRSSELHETDDDARREAWAHYATTREAKLEQRAHELEEERNEYRGGAVMSENEAERWRKRARELESVCRRFRQCFLNGDALGMADAIIEVDKLGCTGGA